MSRDVAGFLAELNRYFEILPPAERHGLDRGVPTTRWEPGRAPRLETTGAGDGRASDAEVLQESFERLRRLRFGTSSFGDELCTDAGRSAFPCWFRDQAGFLFAPSARERRGCRGPTGHAEDCGQDGRETTAGSFL